MMKNYARIFISTMIMALPLFAFAVVQIDPLSLEDKSSFQQVAEIASPEAATPVMIDVPLQFPYDATQTHVVVETATQIPIPSMIITQTQTEKLSFTAIDSFDTPSINNVVDGNMRSFTEFPFDEDEQKNNDVIIDLTANHIFRSSSLSLYLDDHIALPRTVRLASVSEDGTETVLLKRQSLKGRTLSFPEAHTDHLRLTLTYAQPLRIREIVIHESSVTKTIEKFVRFLAKPGMPHQIYFDAENFVSVPTAEAPNFHTEEHVFVIKPSHVSDNAQFKQADTDDDGIVDSDDNCVTVVNPDQIDIDNNGRGDTCDDFDRDGVINATDNCPDDANRAQKDIDGDGIGDVCDEEESRFLEQYPWLPGVTIAVVGVIVVLLIVKVLKPKK